MSLFSKALKKLKKNVKKIGKVAVPGFLVHKLAGKLVKKTGNLPFGHVLAAGITGSDPLSASKPKALLKKNVKALKQGAPLITMAAGLGGASAFAQQALGGAESFLGGGGTPPIVGDEGELPIEPATNPSPAIIAGAVVAGAVLLVLAAKRK